MKHMISFLLLLLSCLTLLIVAGCEHPVSQKIIAVDDESVNTNYDERIVDSVENEIGFPDKDITKPDEDNPVEPEPEPEPLDVGVPEAEPPVDLSGLQTRFFPDLQYGDEPEQLMDLYLVESDEPTPFVVFYHGGGFVAGDKNEVYTLLESSVLEDLLWNKVSVISVNYRLLKQKDEEIGLMKPLSDCKRALQYLRYNAERLRLDKDRVVLMGLSAGAGSSMWVAFNEDQADLQSNDPVLRESTRVNGVVALETQSTYDLVKWETEIFKSFGITVEMAAKYGLRDTIYSFYAIESLEELYTPEIEAYRHKIDMLNLMSFDDPELFVANAHGNAGHPGIDLYSFLHHPKHAQALKNRAEETGVNGRFYAPALGIDDPSGEWIVPFVLRNL